MSLFEIAAFAATAGLAAYIQTLTGFAFGLILMGGVAVTAVMPLPEAAVVVGTLTLVNTSQMLLKGWRHVMRREMALVLLASLPLLALGYFVLEQFADTRMGLLRIVLGLVIIVSSLQLIRPPRAERSFPGKGAFLAVGGIAGLMGGLFSTSGPPLVYHFYRLPLPVASVRETLVAIFAINAIFRLTLVLADGTFPQPRYWPAFLAIPIVAAGTHLARRMPPPLSARAFRLIVFALLCLSGVSLALPPILDHSGF